MLVTITGITSGTSPYNIYVCDSNNTACFFVTGVTSIPPSVVFDTDSFFPYAPAVYLKILDGTLCEKLYLLECGLYGFQNSNIFIFMDGDINVFQ
jgi:hypothetical protein